MEEVLKDVPQSTDMRESVRGKLQYYQEMVNDIDKQKKEKSELEI